MSFCCRTRFISYYLTRWKLQRVWILNERKQLCWFETAELGFETDICQGLRLRNIHYQRSKKRTPRRSKGGRGNGRWKRVYSCSRLSCKQHFTINLFQCWDVHQEQAKLQLKWTLRTKFTFRITSREPFLNKREFCTAKGTTMKIYGRSYGIAFVWTFFSKRRMKMLSRPDGFMLYGKLLLTFSPLLIC